MLAANKHAQSCGKGVVASIDNNNIKVAGDTDIFNLRIKFTFGIEKFTKYQLTIS